MMRKGDLCYSKNLQVILLTLIFYERARLASQWRWYLCWKGKYLVCQTVRDAKDSSLGNHSVKVLMQIHVCLVYHLPVPSRMRWNSESFSVYLACRVSALNVMGIFIFKGFFPVLSLLVLNPRCPSCGPCTCFLLSWFHRDSGTTALCIYWFRVLALDGSCRWSHLAFPWETEEQLHKRYQHPIPGSCERHLICKRACDYGINLSILTWGHPELSGGS